MTPDKTQGGLLARLQELTVCQYLSDLHSPYYIEDVLYALHRVSISSYSTKQWEEAYGYITGVDRVFQSKEELVESLIRYLEKEKEKSE